MSAMLPSLFRRTAVQNFGAAMRTPTLQMQPAIRQFAAKSASPETPLMHYTATQQATSSINHRLFYLNVTAMVLVLDLGNAMLDV
mmetsp:Transcript_65256/g.103404  ORF Transcript_65256/g.103404 Transcript_65256/m.103404 type:complete len:85 (-) Transcript_65256:128-382(-)|eukprot:CAMPEP_0169120832 /NCGR_PEP_ID=MMETSP1015-20121227/32328_1 /TAXON_ID=342587 /ORGANISM="Karlodinium micrum, Strain CCMP2283" /LENGTH=84 /DNA_ID=CAMNT_0009183861 /DNA_START=59 /DNA_END=313 /DNA_ORIENTATION=-